MSDGFEETIVPELDGTGPEIRTCATPGCEQTFEVNPRGFGKNRKMCDGHLTKGGPSKRKDRKPRSVSSVKIDLRPQHRTSNKDKELELVRERTEQLLGFVQVLLVSMGQADDAGDIGASKAAVADAAKELARYEDWLRKLAQGGDTTGRALAWLTMIGALVGMLVPILARHKVIPPEWAEMAGATVVTIPVAESPHGDSPVGEPTAASVG